MSPIDVLRVALGAAVLLVAAIFDARTRRVPNLVWLPLLVGAAGLLVVDGARTLDAWPRLLGAAVLALLAYGGWRGRLYGGADAKAVICLAILLPHPLEGDVIARAFHAPWLPTSVSVVVLSLALGYPLSMMELARKSNKMPYVVALSGAFLLVGISALIRAGTAA